MTRLAFSIAAAVLAASASPAAAAGFDCGKARTADEKAVCANRALNDRDVKMSVLYELDRHFLPMGGRDALTGAQRQFVRKRAACGARLQCLVPLYDRRIAELQRVIDTRVSPQGPF